MNFVWTEQNIEWLEKAAKLTSFYQDLVEICKEFLHPRDSLIDIGCGTGNFSITFAPYVKTVTALDINPLVVKLVQQKCRHLNLRNLYPKLGDWRELSSKTLFDVVFISYVNGLASEELEQLASLSTRLIIGVLPKYGREKSFGLENYIRSNLSNSSGRDTFSKAVSYLQGKGIAFQAQEYSCDFGQPFDNLKDYQAFLNFYFGLKEEDIPAEYTANYLQKTAQGYYLPNLKECGIIIIRKDDLR